MLRQDKLTNSSESKKIPRKLVTLLLNQPFPKPKQEMGGANSVQETESDTIRVIILCDATGSMGSVLRTLSPVLGELIPMLSICFETCLFSTVFYRDYDMGPTVVNLLNFTSNEKEIREFIKTHATPAGGGDYPEAQKSALMEMYSNKMLNNRTLVIHYTDAPPHADVGEGTEASNERKYFSEKGWDHRWDKIVQLVTSTGATFITLGNGTIHELPWYKQLGKTLNCTFYSQEIIMKDTMQTIQQELGIGCEGNPRFKVSLESIGARLKDSAYFEKVVDIFTRQLNERGIKAAIDILCNKVTSEVWRKLLTMRTNETVISLRNKFSLLANGATTEHKKLQDLIGESFNRMAMVDELLQGIEGEIKVLTCSDVWKVPVSDLQDFFGAFNKETLAAILLNIQSLQEEVVSLGDVSENPISAQKIIPVDIQDEKFFSLITHLITPGYIASFRQSAMIALLCLYDSRLSARADKFLEAKKGKWLNFSLQGESIGGFQFPENLNLGFVHFLFNHQKYITEEETVMLKSFVNMSNIYRSKDSSVLVTTAVTPNKDILPFPISKCNKCNKNRVDSLQLPEACAFCVIEDQNAPESTDKSMVVTCRTCYAVYGVVRKELMKVEPKCYYCKNGKPAPTVQCTVCMNPYLFPNYQGGPFTCYSCTANGLQTADSQVNIPAIICENQEVLKDTFVLPIDSIVQLLTNKSCNKPITIFAQYVKANTHMQFANIRPLETVKEKLLLKKRPVFNSAEVLTGISNRFLNISAIGDKDCFICGETLPALLVRTICMRKACNGLVCTKCAFSWLANTRAGEIIEYAQCSCPFCRNPFHKSIGKFHSIAKLKIPEEAYEQSLRNCMAWCCGCNTMKIFCERVCLQEAPQVRNFVCSDCTANVKESSEKSLSNVDRIVKCSKCGGNVCKALVINGVTNYGCNHVQCESCNSHVCAFKDCGAAFPESALCYSHMQDVHGSFFDDGLDEAEGAEEEPLDDYYM